MPGRPLGRLDPPDWNHLSLFPLMGLETPPPVPAVVERNLDAVYPRTSYNQGSKQACVGAGCSRLSSIDNRKLYDLFWLWNQAKRLDGFGDPNQDRGTTVRAGFEVLRTLGHVAQVKGKDQKPSTGEGISEYRWCKTVDEVRAAIAASLPVVIGIGWFNSFDNPQKAGSDFFIGRGDPSSWGPVRGGHCVCVFGASDRRQAFRFVNSWGAGYPVCYLTYSCMDYQLKRGAEAGVVTDRL